MALNDRVFHGFTKNGGRYQLFCDVRCSRHAGSVAAHRRCAATFASARPPCRLSNRKIFSDGISAVSEVLLVQRITKGRTGGGVFFERKRRKKAHRTGRPKRVFTCRQQKCQTLTDGSAYACLLTTTEMPNPNGLDALNVSKRNESRSAYALLDRHSPQ